jgi:lipoxygenase homology domain-containing protein 1
VYHPGGLCNSQTFYFPCNEWLIGPAQGPKNCKELHVSSGAESSARCTYQVQVFTTDVRGAGTDGDVFLSLVGELGTTGESELASSANNFERGHVDQFTVQSEDIGTITAAEVRQVDAS